MKTHEEALLRLKSHLNESTPISILPPECLIEIFKTYAAAYIRSKLDGQYCNHLLPFPYIHVCRSWRTLSLNYPLLWNVIHLRHSPERISFFLEHSQQVSLVAHCPRPDEKAEPAEAALQSEATRRFLQDNISRIVSLILVIHSGISNTRIACTSRLKRLIVFEDYRSDKEDTEAFLGLIHGTDAPMLQYLHYEGVRTGWLSDASHTNLTEFRLETAGLESVGPLLAVLSRMPVLQIFRFRGMLPKALPPSRQNSDVITLSHLHTIEIDDSVHRFGRQNSLALNLLSYLDLPSVTMICIILVECPNDELPLASIHSFAKFQHASIVPIQSSRDRIGWSMTLSSNDTTEKCGSTLNLNVWPDFRSPSEVASGRLWQN